MANKIYNIRTGYVITCVQAGDDTIRVAREIARERGHAVIVEGVTGKYKITPNGHKSPPPKWWSPTRIA